jgi:hypothetical protein
MHFGVISLSEEPLLYPLYQTTNFIRENPEYSGRVLPLRVGEFLKTGPAYPVPAPEPPVPET